MRGESALRRGGLSAAYAAKASRRGELDALLPWLTARVRVVEEPALELEVDGATSAGFFSRRNGFVDTEVPVVCVLTGDWTIVAGVWRANEAFRPVSSAGVGS